MYVSFRTIFQQSAMDMGLSIELIPNNLDHSKPSSFDGMLTVQIKGWHYRIPLDQTKCPVDTQGKGVCPLFLEAAKNRFLGKPRMEEWAINPKMLNAKDANGYYLYSCVDFRDSSLGG